MIVPALITHFHGMYMYSVDITRTWPWKCLAEAALCCCLMCSGADSNARTSRANAAGLAVGFSSVPCIDKTFNLSSHIVVITCAGIAADITG